MLTHAEQLESVDRRLRAVLADVAVWLTGVTPGPEPDPGPERVDFAYDGARLWVPAAWYAEQGIRVEKWERWTWDARGRWRKVGPSHREANPTELEVWVPGLQGDDAMFFQLHGPPGTQSYEVICRRGQAWTRPPSRQLVVYTAPGAPWPPTHDQARFILVGENWAGKKYRLVHTEAPEVSVPAPKPQPIPKPGSPSGGKPTGRSFVYGASSWDHGHPGYIFATAANYTYDHQQKAKGEGRHFLSVKWSKNERFSRRQQADICKRAKDMGFVGINIDLENKLFYERGYVEEWTDTITASGLIGVCCPKATLGELSGNPFPATGHNPDKFVKYMRHIGFSAMMPWAYGGHGQHVWAYEVCRQYFDHLDVCVLHDSFRDWDGYIGQSEWPKLVRWARGFPAGERPLLGLFEQRKEIEVRGRAEYEATIRELDGLYA